MIEWWETNRRIIETAILLDFMTISVGFDIIQIVTIMFCLFGMQINSRGCIIRQRLERKMNNKGLN